MLQCNMQAVEVADCRVTPVNEKTSKQRNSAIKYLTAAACIAAAPSVFEDLK
jgi:hypothetical protein